MSYRSEGYKSPFIGVGIVTGVILAVILLLRVVAMLDGPSTLTTPAGVEQNLFSNAETGPMYRTLKRTYPQEFDALTQDVARRVKAGEPRAEIDEAILTDLIETAKRHRKDVIQAPHDRFTDFRRAEIAVVEALQKTDPQLCATYIMTGQVRSQAAQMPQAPMIAHRIAQLEAGAAGRDHPVNRIVAPPAPADVQQLGRLMMANGATESLVKAFFSNASLTGLSPQEQCFTGLAFFHAIDQLPGDKADQFYAFLISRDT